jgi:hypothetical protein
MAFSASRGSTESLRGKATDKASTDMSSKVKSTKQPAGDSSEVTSASSNDSGVVFGSFSLEYPVTGIETERADGVTIVNCMPECRVFICGGEVTKDVTGVTVSYTADNMSTCTIGLANPRGKYSVAISDLVADKSGSLWREDKSIQATYDYDWLKKQVPSTSTSTDNKTSESKATKVGNALLGKQITSTFKSVVSGIQNMSRNRQKGFTQMVYEIKQQSNIHKAIGETVFDYRDPVTVFFKGRFSTYWYFGFSGMVSSIDSSYAYGSQESISLQCHDVIGILKRKKFTQQGAILAAANLEAAIFKGDAGKKFNFYDDVKGNFSKVIKQIMWVSEKDQVDAVENSHFYYTPKCSLTKTDPKTKENKSSENKESGNDTIDVNEPYVSKTKYMNEFRDIHKFDNIHTDDQERNNTGKQFREFKLVEEDDKPAPKPITIELEGLEFHASRINYILAKDENSITSADEKPKSYYMNKPVPQEVYGILKNVIDKMREILEEDPSITWTVVGHVSVDTGVPVLPRSAELKAYLKSGNSYCKLDLGTALVDYPHKVDVTHGGRLSLPPKLNTPMYLGYFKSNPHYSFNPDLYTPHGEGWSLSETRAARALKNMKEVAKSLSADSKYTLVNNVVQSMQSKGVGSSQPRNIKKQPVVGVTLTSAAMVKQYSSGSPESFFSRTGKAEINRINRFIELVPNKKEYKKKEKNAGLGNDSTSYVKDPHKYRFSPSSDIYFQFNEININDFTPENLDIFYKTSVRYWLKGPGTELDTANLGNPHKTGWKHTHGFGVCGIHPAMTYDFIDNFNILPDVHATAMRNPKLLDGATLTPSDVVREQVFGIGLHNSILATNETQSIGTQHNYFRPRIFLVVPKKFRQRERFVYNFGQMTLDKMNASSTYSMLERLILDFEYTIYSSPMGDLFIEPLMHDFHPLDFYGKMEDRAICNRVPNGAGSWDYSGADVYFRTTIHTYDQSIIGYRKDKAYIFNTKANHPFFITNKDLKRVTDTIKPENLVSHVILEGSSIPYSKDAALVQGGLDKFAAGTVSYIDIESHVKNTSEKDGELTLVDSQLKTSTFQKQIGMYMANGFNVMQASSLKNSGALTKLKAKRDESIKVYTYKLYNNFMSLKQDSTLGSIVAKAAEGIQKLTLGDRVIYNTRILNLVEKYVKASGYFADSLSTQLIIDSYTQYQVDDRQLTAMTELAPELLSLYMYVFNYAATGEEEGGEAKNKILSQHNIKTILGENGLFKLLVTKLTYGVQYSSIDNTSLDKSLIDQLAINIDLKASEAYTADTKIILEELLLLYEVDLLADNTIDSRAFRDLSTEICIMEKQIANAGNLDGFLTRGDLKTYENLQLYDPSKDFVSRYGWNPGPTIRNTYISNGAEAEIYCKVLFDKINSKAFQLSCDLIGRPELGLNRPYYVEKNTCIGLCTDYSITYKPSTAFSSNVTLTFLRRNALAYSYTLGNLDRVTTLNDSAADAHTNAFFNTKALNYFKSIFAADKTAERYKFVDKFVSSIAIAGVKGAVTGGAVQSFLGIKKKSDEKAKEADPARDGLYVAHDCIGHTDYNNKYGIKNLELFTKKVTSESTGDPKYVAQLGGRLITREQAQAIVAKNSELHVAFMLLQTLEQEYEYNTIKLYKQTQQHKLAQEAETAFLDLRATLLLTPAEIDSCDASIAQYTKLRNEIEVWLYAIRTERAEIEKSYVRLTTRLFGVPAGYTPAATTATTTLNYSPSSARRSAGAKFNKDKTTSIMYNLYAAIPQYDVNGATLRERCLILDDTTMQSDDKVTGLAEDVPLYIDTKALTIDSAESKKIDAGNQDNRNQA